jgi:uncharacterized integral membrane protein (TIGR00698 family)
MRDRDGSILPSRDVAPSRHVLLPRDVLPGLAFVALFVAASLAAGHVVDPLSPLVAAVVLGVVVGNLGLVPHWAAPGLTFSARRLLRAGVVLLGFQLSVAQVASLGGRGVVVVVVVVAATFVGTRWMGRRLGLTDGLSMLVAAGYAICGASAIAAMEDVADATEEEVAAAIALVTLCGSLAIGLLPLLRSPLALDDVDVFGSWVGASVHDVGQVVATASSGGTEALRAAVLVKLTRVVLLAPMIVITTIAARRRTAAAAGAGAPPHVGAPLLPLFVAGFIAAVLVRSTGVLSADHLRWIRHVQLVLLGAALFALGAGVRLAKLRSLGHRPLILGLASWLLIGAISYVGVRLAHA